MFSNVAFSVVAFLIALGILIAIHEFGHFWVARKVGINAIPLGGYVKMLDERVDTVPAEESHRAFNQQPLWARVAVVIAGPLANFILAIAAYWLVLMIYWGP